MWCDILNKPKQGASYRLNRSHLMNVPVEYDDDVERRLTHLALLNKGDDDEYQEKWHGVLFAGFCVFCSCSVLYSS